MEPTYRVVWPLGRSTCQPVSVKSRVVDLSGMTIGEISHGGFRDSEIRPILEKELSQRFPRIKFIDSTNFGNIRDPNDPNVISSIPDKLRKFGCDAVICGVGG